MIGQVASDPRNNPFIIFCRSSEPNGKDDPTGDAACVAWNRGGEVESLSLTFSQLPAIVYLISLMGLMKNSEYDDARGPRRLRP
jgi:hypothetical protein